MKGNCGECNRRWICEIDPKECNEWPDSALTNDSGQPEGNAKGGFVKPKGENVKATDYILKLLNANLHKDLHDNEEICQHCYGTGLVIADHRYGLSDDPDKSHGHFPYNHQALSFCPHCHNGIVHRCKFCGRILPKGRLKCDCAAQLETDRQEKIRKKKEAFNNAPVAPKEVEDAMECFYSECFGDNNGYFFDWDEFFNFWYDTHEPDDVKPEYVWITEPVEMQIDAADIISSATEDLYEDAADDISSAARKDLQDFLDGWCKNCGVGTTYYESHKYKVKIPWEQH